MLRDVGRLSDEDETVVATTIGCAIEVHRHLGPGFRERIYERALCLELELRGISFECQREIDVCYKQWKIPGQRIDLIVANIVIVEIKAIPRVKTIHRHQVVSYLRSTGLHVGLIVNFNTTLLKHGLHRVVRSN